MGWLGGHFRRRQATDVDPAAAALAVLAARTGHLFQVPADFAASNWNGRASAGTSATTKFSKAGHTTFSGSGHDTVDPSLTSISGQPWLLSAGESALGATNLAGTVGKMASDIFPLTGFLLTSPVRFDLAEAGNAGPNGYRHALGVNSTGFGYLLRANGQVTIFMLDSAGGTYQQVEIGALAVGTPGVVQIAFDSASGVWKGRVNKGAWAQLAGTATRSTWSTVQFSLMAFDGLISPPATAFKGALGVQWSEAYTATTATQDLLATTVGAASGLTI